MTTYPKYYIIAIISFILNVSYNCSLLFGQSYPTFEYKRSVYISTDYQFNNEFLYKPYQVREIPATKEIAILDIGNVCIYTTKVRRRYYP